VIDADYRGNVGVLLFNFGNEEFKVGGRRHSRADLKVRRCHAAIA
jgi:dUTPase